MPLIYARGVFQYSFGLMPYRKPINTVGTTPRWSHRNVAVSRRPQLLSLSSVGKPIRVVQTPSPTSEDIEQLHRTYLQSLTQLFEEHKHHYGLQGHQHLTFI